MRVLRNHCKQKQIIFQLKLFELKMSDKTNIFVFGRSNQTPQNGYGRHKTGGAPTAKSV